MNPELLCYNLTMQKDLFALWINLLSLCHSHVIRVMTIAKEIQRERISEEVAPAIVMQAEVLGIGKETEEVER